MTIWEELLGRVKFNIPVFENSPKKVSILKNQNQNRD